MEIKDEHVYLWYQENIRLIQQVCWKAKYRSDCGRNITFDDLMSHCLDKIITVFGNYFPDKGTKLSTFVTLSLRFECMKYIEKVNKISKRFTSLRREDVGLHLVDNENVKYIDEDDLADKIFVELEKELSPIELRIYLLRLDKLTFEEIAVEVDLKIGKVKIIYYNSFFKARKQITQKYLADYMD